MDPINVRTELLEAFVSITIAFIASTGFWTWNANRTDKKHLQTQLLIGLAHDRIIYLGMSFISRGWITQDEYENYVSYLYKPYEQLGGNGSAKRIMDEVNKLPIRPNIIFNQGEKKQ